MDIKEVLRNENIGKEYELNGILYKLKTTGVCLVLINSITGEAIEETGFKPWFSSIWEPPSGEIESLLFALQAAIGAIIIGYAFGYWRGQGKEE